jgi:LysM repeat protein
MKFFRSQFSHSVMIFIVLSNLVLNLFLFAPPAIHAQASTETPSVTSTGTPITAQGIIDAFNKLRRSHNMRGLVVDPILMGLAQQDSDYMALNSMTSDIGNVRGRAMAAGYGAGDIPWLTENFAIDPQSLEELMMIWGDADHMRGANNLWYAHCGVGISEYNGDVYYVFIAGYTSNRIYKPGATALPGQTLTAPVSQVMFPVIKATPGADGTLIHTVQHGQTLWAIAIAYGTHILDIQRANGMTADQVDLSEGRNLIIHLSGMVPTSTQIARSPTSVINNESPTPFIEPSQTSALPTNEAKPLSGEFIIVLAAILAAVGLIGFGLFVSRGDKG